MDPISATGRRWAEYLSRRVVLRRNLSKEFGSTTLFVTPDARLGMWRRDLSLVDPKLLNLARMLVLPGHTVWDIGANVGMFTFAAAWRAGHTGRVLAVEADAVLCKLMRRSAARVTAECASVDVVCVAADDEDGLAEFFVASRARAASHLGGHGSSQTGGVREKVFVPTLKLDTILINYPPPCLIKIDVEGAEAQVLEGAARVLQKHRPIVICEVGEICAGRVTDIFDLNDYLLFDGDTYGSGSVPVTGASWNTVALPREIAKSKSRH